MPRKRREIEAMLRAAIPGPYAMPYDRIRAGEREIATVYHKATGEFLACAWEIVNDLLNQVEEGETLDDCREQLSDAESELESVQTELDEVEERIRKLEDELALLSRPSPGRRK